jgi:drug/metabolite transporter (DMT)-like permease
VPGIFLDRCFRRGTTTVYVDQGFANDATYRRENTVLSKEIKIAMLGLVGSVLTAVLPTLIAKPLDLGLSIVLVTLIGSTAWVVIFVLRQSERAGRKVQKAGAREAPVPGARKGVRTLHALPAAEASVRGIIAGFLYALAAALCWSIGNVLMRLTAHKLPASSFDIAMLNYLVGALVLIVGGQIVCRWQGHPPRPSPSSARAKFWLAAVAKGFNTYSWILAVSVISAASAATLEGLHVIFTVAICFLILRIKAPAGNWFVFVASALLMVLGALLILDVHASIPSGTTLIGIALGLISALAFSVFYVTWVRTGQRPPELGRRAVEMGGLLLASLLCQFPIHVITSILWPRGNPLPFANMGAVDIATQALCGLIGIGATYFLINESLHRMRGQALTSVVLGIGLSYSVPFTMILESVFLGAPTLMTQWLGALVFAAAFASIYSYLRASDATAPARAIRRRVK